MSKRAIDPELIRPAEHGKSDKFSWRLYRWMKRHGTTYNRIVSRPWNIVDGPVPGADPYDLQSCTVYAALMEPGDSDLMGARIQRITAGDGKRWAFVGTAGDAVDITDWFWSEYLRIGRCLIHGDMVHSWKYDQPWDRSCRYCGKRETMNIKVRIQRDEIWGAA